MFTLLIGLTTPFRLTYRFTAIKANISHKFKISCTTLACHELESSSESIANFEIGIEDGVPTDNLTPYPTETRTCRVRLYHTLTALENLNEILSNLVRDTKKIYSSPFFKWPDLVLSSLLLKLLM